MQMNKAELVGKSLEASKACKVQRVWPSVCCCLRFHRTRFWRSGRVQNTRLNWAGWPRLGTGSCSLPPGTSTTSATARTGATPTQCSPRISPVCGAACSSAVQSEMFDTNIQANGWLMRTWWCFLVQIQNNWVLDCLI